MTLARPHRIAPSDRERHDPLGDRRKLAEWWELPAACPHKGCRGARRCRGPQGRTEALPGAALPACLADMFEELHAPVRRWTAFWDRLDSSTARIETLLDKHYGNTWREWR
jgi:hypothetical protein